MHMSKKNMENMDSIAVVLTVHNRCACTIKCLQSLYEEYQHMDVYLTDDGCTDDTVESVRTQFPDVIILKGDGNLFWNRGMHLAYGKALEHGYDYYLLINDDIILSRGFLPKMLNCVKQLDNKSIVCGVTVDPETKERTYGIYTKNVQAVEVSNEVKYGYFSNANLLLVPAEIATAIGNLDYYFRHSLGDFDYTGRAVMAGYSLAQCPGVCAYCKRHEKLPKWRDVQYKLSDRLKHLYSPTGRNPKEFLHFDKRHYGIMIAIMHYLSIHLRCFFPRLFMFDYNEKE